MSYIDINYFKNNIKIDKTLYLKFNKYDDYTPENRYDKYYTEYLEYKKYINYKSISFDYNTIYYNSIENISKNINLQNIKYKSCNKNIYNTLFNNKIKIKNLEKNYSYDINFNNEEDNSNSEYNELIKDYNSVFDNIRRDYEDKLNDYNKYNYNYNCDYNDENQEKYKYESKDENQEYKDIIISNYLYYYLISNNCPNVLSVKMYSDDNNLNFYKKNNPLMYYCMNKNIKKLDKNIMRYYSLFTYVKNISGETPLMYYLKFNKNPSIDEIKLFNYDTNNITNTENLELKNEYNYTHLMYYCMNKNLNNSNIEIIKLFKEQIGLRDLYGNTALMYYCYFNKNPSIEIIKLLQDEISIFDNSNTINSLLIYCDRSYLILDLEIIKLLYNYDLDLNKNKEINFLYQYLTNNIKPDIEIIKYLMEKNTTNYLFKYSTTLIIYLKKIF